MHAIMLMKRKWFSAKKPAGLCAVVNTSKCCTTLFSMSALKVGDDGPT